MDLKKSIKEVYRKKLMYQFRNPKYTDRINKDLDFIVEIYSEKIYDKGVLDGETKTVEMMRRNYKDYIKIPEATIKNRLKFLFLGKL